MNEQIKDGGPAYPRTGVGNAGVGYDVPPQDGMSLRDFFAAAAMQGMLSCQDFFNDTIKLCESRDEARAQIAFWAYEQANEMLRRRGL